MQSGPHKELFFNYNNEIKEEMPKPKVGDDIFVFLVDSEDEDSFRWYQGRVEAFDSKTNNIKISYSDQTETKDIYDESIMRVASPGGDSEYYNQRVMIYSEEDDKWKIGTVAQCDANNKALVLFDDGSSEEVRLRPEEILFRLPSDFRMYLDRFELNVSTERLDQIIERMFSDTLTKEEIASLRKLDEKEFDRIINIADSLAIHYKPQTHYNTVKADLPDYLGPEPDEQYKAETKDLLKLRLEEATYDPNTEDLIIKPKPKPVKFAKRKLPSPKPIITSSSSSAAGAPYTTTSPSTSEDSDPEQHGGKSGHKKRAKRS